MTITRGKRGNCFSQKVKDFRIKKGELQEVPSLQPREGGPIPYYDLWSEGGVLQRKAIKPPLLEESSKKSPRKRRVALHQGIRLLSELSRMV